MRIQRTMRIVKPEGGGEHPPSGFSSLNPGHEERMAQHASRIRMEMADIPAVEKCGQPAISTGWRRKRAAVLARVEGGETVEQVSVATGYSVVTLEKMVAKARLDRGEQ